MRTLYVLVAITLALGAGASALAAEKPASKLVIRQEDNSGVSGAGTITDNGNGTVTVRVTLKNDPGGVHPEHLHEGVCTGTIPTVRYPLNDIRNGKATTTIEASMADLSETPLYLNIHESKENLARVIACAQVEGVERMPRSGLGAIAVSQNAIAVGGLVLAITVLMAGAWVSGRSAKA
jgi:hypothetical protein